MAKKHTLEIAVEFDDDGTPVKVSKIGDAAEKAGVKGEKGMNRIRKGVADLDKSTAISISSLAKLAAVSFAGLIAGIALVTATMTKSFAAASDLEEATSKFGVVFDGQIGKADAWADKLVENYAMSTREARHYLSSVQDMLVPMGMVPAAAGEMSQGIATIASDLGSFNNLPTAQVVGDIQSALVGSYEPMMKYGAVLTAATVEQKALSMGLVSTKDELTAAHKAQAAYQLIVEASSAAIGDMARTADGYANQIKQYHALTEDLTAAMGKRLLPVAADVLSRINAGMKDGKGGVDSLAESISVKLLKSLGFAVETMRFFHNGWLGIKLVGTAAIDAIAQSVDFLYGGLRLLMKPLDLAFQGAVKLGVVDVNPFDGIESTLGSFAASSRDVTKSVLADIEATNASYDGIKSTIGEYIAMVKDADSAELQLANTAQTTATTQITTHQSISNAVHAKSAVETSTFEKSQRESELKILALNGIDQAKTVATDSWLQKDQLAVDSTKITNQELETFTKEFVSFSNASISDVVSAFTRGEDLKVTVAGIASSKLSQFAIDSATKGLEPIFEALGGQIGAWIGLGTAQTSTEGVNWQEKLGTAAAYLAGAGAAVFAGRAIGDSFHAQGGWIGRNPQGGIVMEGTPGVDNVFAGYTDRGFTRNWIAKNEYVIPEAQTAKYYPLLEAIRADKVFADGGPVGDAWQATRDINSAGFEAFWLSLLDSNFNWYKAAADSAAYYGGTGSTMVAGKAIGKQFFKDGGPIRDRGFFLGGIFDDLLDPFDIVETSTDLLDDVLPIIDPIGEALKDELGQQLSLKTIWNLLRKMPIVGESVEHADNILFPFVRDTLTPGKWPSFGTLEDMLKGVFRGIEKEGKALLTGGLSSDILGILHDGTDYVPETGTYFLKEGETVKPAKGYSGDGEIVAAINALKDLLESVGFAVSKNTGDTNRLLKKFDAIGLGVRA